MVRETRTRLVPRETIRNALLATDRHRRRIRRWPATAVVCLVIAIGIAWSSRSRMPRPSPATEWVVLYPERWEIEIGKDELTPCVGATLGLRVGTRGRQWEPALPAHPLDRRVHLRSRTPCGILQEVYGILIAYHAVRFLMHQAALSMDLDPRRWSFIHAVRVLRETAPLRRAASAERRPTRYRGMIAPLARGVLPVRDPRIHPRVIQKKMSNFPQKRAQHYRPQHPQTSFEQAVRILK